MAVPRSRAGRSAIVGAILSFILPGAGQAYVGDWSRAAFFGIPAVIGLLLAARELGQGVSHVAARLLDPAVAVGLLLLIVLLAAWRAWSVVHAWRVGRRTLGGAILMPVLLALIVGMHGFAFITTASMLGAGERIASDGDSLLEPVPPAFGATPAPSSRLPAGGVTATGDPQALPSAPPSSTLAPGEDPYEQYDDEPEPRVVAGPRPGYDVAAIDTQADGLLNVLIVGIDWKPGRDSRRTDSMIVVSVNTETGEVYMFSFPRDISHFPMYNGGTYEGKLNGFASYANRHPGQFPDGGLKSLGYQLGFLLGIPIDYYAAVDIPGFEKVVEAVGGVTVNNPKAINDTYIDGGKGFHLPAGKHRLNAADALRYVRSRHGSSDFARAQRQQQVLSALRREMTKPDQIGNLPSIMDAISGVLRTDFPRDRLTELIKLSEKVSDEPTNGYVFRPPTWATFTPRTETTRSITQLRVERLRELSLELFGEKSLYNR
ncbi:MAG TPA: LCP family protein [Candidatus Limnocylindrales bacterium]|nr:LCP family protein [Candidatus Limnocylindrales bacterium]